MPPALFALFFDIGFHIMPGPAWTAILLILHIKLVCATMPTFLLVEMGSLELYALSELHLPYLCFPSS
jgi:hypothetical protein